MMLRPWEPGTLRAVHGEAEKLTFRGIPTFRKPDEGPPGAKTGPRCDSRDESGAEAEASARNGVQTLRLTGSSVSQDPAVDASFSGDPEPVERGAKGSPHAPRAGTGRLGRKVTIRKAGMQEGEPEGRRHHGGTESFFAGTKPRRSPGKGRGP